MNNTYAEEIAQQKIGNTSKSTAFFFKPEVISFVKPEQIQVSFCVVKLRCIWYKRLIKLPLAYIQKVKKKKKEKKIVKSLDIVFYILATS